MTLQSITPYNPQMFNAPFAKQDSVPREKPFGKYGSAGGRSNVSFAATYYSSDTLSVEYTNKDGDTVSLSMEHVEYQKAMLSFSGDTDSAEWKQIVDKVKEEFLHFQEQIIQKFIASINGEENVEPGGETTAASGEIEGLPEYWNAENTSQRIVDFATSFYGVAESGGKEYYEMMRNAIEEGFNQAMGILGELPDAVGNLANNTFDLAMEKLDAWAAEQGIDIGDVVAEV